MTANSTVSSKLLMDSTAAQHATEEIIRKHSKTFYFATGLLPEKSRAAIRALYAFCRETDDLVDRKDTTLSDLEAWRTLVNRPAEEQDHPTLYVWAKIRQAYPVNRKYEQELIDGVGMDLDFHPYQTWDELANYCYHVAATVGLLSMPIIGLADGADFEQAARHAIQLGIALQLTNILRDVGEDMGRGRVYLPVEDLKRFHLSIEDIRAGVYDERFIGMMKYEIARARQIYREALPGITLLSKAARPAVGAAALLYAAILDEIEKLDYQVYTHRAHTSAWKKITLLPHILWTIAHVRIPGEQAA
jgi:15-cis-phytoene synthase